MDTQRQKLIAFHLGHEYDTSEPNVNSVVSNRIKSLSETQVFELESRLNDCVTGYDNLIQSLGLNSNVDELNVRTAIFNHCIQQSQGSNYGENEKLYWFSLTEISKILQLQIQGFRPN